MIPHERSLVKELAGRPFAIVGVNTDGREAYAKGIKNLPVTWRSFDDGNPEGPICKRWSIGGFRPSTSSTTSESFDTSTFATPISRRP